MMGKIVGQIELSGLRQKEEKKNSEYKNNAESIFCHSHIQKVWLA